MKKVVLTIKSINIQVSVLDPLPFHSFCFMFMFEKPALFIETYTSDIFFFLTNKWPKLINWQQSKRWNNCNVYCRTIPMNYNWLQRLEWLTQLWRSSRNRVNEVISFFLIIFCSFLLRTEHVIAFDLLFVTPQKCVIRKKNKKNFE